MGVSAEGTLLERFRERVRRVMPRRLVRDEKGAAAIEFAFVAFPFFALIGAIMETGLVFLADTILATATVDTARLIRTGQASDTSAGPAMTHEQFDLEVCKRLYILFNCLGLATDVRQYPSFSAASYTVPIDKDGNFVKSDLQWNAGASMQIVVVRAYYQFPLVFTGFGLKLANIGSDKHLLTAVTAFRTEPYPW